MSTLKQRRFLDLMERLGLVGDDQLPNATLGMDYLGAMAERAFMPRQHLNEHEDRRLAHQDLEEMTRRDLWCERQRAEFVVAWGDDRTGWVWERLEALRVEEQRRGNRA
jgi:hypothetical protein